MSVSVEEVARERRDRAHRPLSIEGLKQLVLARFPEDHPLRDVILAEKDVLTFDELLAKMPVWLVLLNRRT